MKFRGKKDLELKYCVLYLVQ